jgi:hypothetical protein
MKSFDVIELFKQLPKNPTDKIEYDCEFINIEYRHGRVPSWNERTRGYPYVYDPYPLRPENQCVKILNRLGYHLESDIPALEFANSQTGNPTIISTVVDGKVELYRVRDDDMGSFWKAYKNFKGE